MSSIREARKAKDLGLREAAKLLGISGAHLCDLELGRRLPSEELRAKIEGLLGDVGLVRAKAAHLLSVHFPSLSDEDVCRLAVLIEDAERNPTPTGEKRG